MREQSFYVTLVLQDDKKEYFSDVCCFWQEDTGYEVDFFLLFGDGSHRVFPVSQLKSFRVSTVPSSSFSLSV